MKSNKFGRLIIGTVTPDGKVFPSPAFQAQMVELLSRTGGVDNSSLEAEANSLAPVGVFSTAAVDLAPVSVTPANQPDLGTVTIFGTLSPELEPV